jgi:hypothetical protein
LTAIAYPVKSVESEVDGDVTGGVEYSDWQSRSDPGMAIDSDLSLLDDLFADMSLLP